MSQSLTTILDALEEQEKLAGVDLQAVNPRVRAGVAMAKVDATRRLEELREEYRVVMASRVAVILVSGPRVAQEALAQLAREEGETLTVDALAMYIKIAQDVEPTIGHHRQFGGTQLNHLLRSLEEVGRAAGATFLPVPRLVDIMTVESFDDLVEAVRTIIRPQVGDDLNRKYMERLILDQALAARYEERTVPVVVLATSDQEESVALQEALFGGVGVQVALVPGQKIDKDLIFKAFADLKAAKKK